MNLIKEEAFSGSYNGKETALYTLRNKNGIVAQVTNYGAAIVSIFTPDRNGNFVDIVQGCDNISDYINGNGPYQGVICGRCANRIAKGKFTLGGKEYSLAINNGPNHLHGGLVGFNRVVWTVTKSTGNQVALEYLSIDGEENYPGNLKVNVTYTLTDANELRLDYSATTDKATPINLASHSYFNMAGEGSGKMLDQLLMINADFYTPIDATSIPTGEIRSVVGTPMDFTKAKSIGADIFGDDVQLKNGAGFDHNWVLKNRVGDLGLAAVAVDPKSGRAMEVYTTQPGVQFYSSNWMENERGKNGKLYNKHEAFCLETQHFPDTINQLHFPSNILKPDETYKHSCMHKFCIH
jgi:aldose 1-epimerase